MVLIPPVTQAGSIKPAGGGDQMAAHSVTGLEPNDSPDPGEAPSNEPDTGADVQQEGDFQGNY
jgi:hypothetical protein